MSAESVGQSTVASAPIGVEGFIQPRRAAFWLLVFFLANGLYSVILLVLNSHHVVPEAMWLSLLLWTLYALPFVGFIRALDLDEEHSVLGFVLAFAWGGLGAVYLAIPANDAIFALAGKLGSPEFKTSWGAAIAGPTTEEFLKYAGVVLLVMVARTQLRTPLSVVLTGAVVGLGFQIAENFVYATNAAVAATSDDQLTPVLSTFLVRGLLCGLWSHSVYTAVSAYGLAVFLFDRQASLAKRVGAAALFFALAWLLHATWNSPILSSIQAQGLGGAFLYIFIKGIPVLVVGIWIWRMALREQATYLDGLAELYVQDPALIAPDERPVLACLGTRRAERMALRKRAGRAAARQLRALQRAQLRLLTTLGRWGPGTRATVHERRVRKARRRLQALLATAAQV